MADKQTSDYANKGIGLGVRSLTPKPFQAGSGAVQSGAITPSGNSTSGTSQSNKRGKQGNG